MKTVNQQMATLWFRLVVGWLSLSLIFLPPLAPTICWSHAPFPSWNPGVIEEVLVAFPSTTGWFQWDFWPWEYDVPNFLRYAAWYLSSDLGPLVACTFYPATSSISSWSFSITRTTHKLLEMQQQTNCILLNWPFILGEWFLLAVDWCLASCFFSSHFWLHRKIWWRSSGDRYKPWLLYHPSGVPAPTVPWVVGTRCQNWEVAALLAAHRLTVIRLQPLIWEMAG